MTPSPAAPSREKAGGRVVLVVLVVVLLLAGAGYAAAYATARGTIARGTTVALLQPHIHPWRRSGGSAPPGRWTRTWFTPVSPASKPRALAAM